MAMANGMHTQEKRIQFKKRATVTQILPDAPEGGWDAIIPKGSCQISEKNGDPVLSFKIKLVKAHEEANESSQGVELRQRITFYDPADHERKGAGSMNYRFARGLCKAVDADFEEVYPTTIESSDDLQKLAGAIEGTEFEMWTVHRKSQFNGEDMVNVDVRFAKPGAGLVTKGADDEDEDRPGKKPAKKAARR